MIQSYYLSPYGGSFRGVESIYKGLTREIIGISREQVAKALMKMESKQITHSANQTILQPIKTSRVMERLQIDLIDFSKNAGIQKFNKLNFILTCIDTFSKMLWAFPLNNKSSSVVANTLQNFFCTEGKWSILQHDQGGEFEGDVIVLCERWGIKNTRSLPYSSKSQGQVEKVNHILRQAIVKYLAENSTKVFVDALPALVYGYNTKKQRSSKFTPFEVHRRRHEQFPIDTIVKANLEKMQK